MSVRGSVIVPVRAGLMSLSTALRYRASKGRQDPEGFVGEAKDILEESVDKAAYEQVGLTLSSTQTNEERLEVNPVA